jgi:molecular chaperone DnaJ
MTDYYDTLGVEKKATQEEIKRAYRKLALQFHPDRNQGSKVSEEKFKEINEAYSCLGDPEKRNVYDQTGYCDTGPTGAGFGNAGFGRDIFENIFGDIFGAFGMGAGPSARRGPPPERGMDYRYDLEITLREAATGVKKTITVPRSVACADCGGSGSRTGKTTSCPDCRGTGSVRYQQGFFTISRNCQRCGGEGRTIAEPCGKCRGTGKVAIERELTITIPTGVESGTRFRMGGEGEAGSHGGPPGDLYVIADVLEDPVFKRDGENIHVEIPISFAQASLGADVEIETLWGQERLHIAAGTQPGQAYRLKGKGMPVMGKRHKGDQIVYAKIIIPTKLTEKEKELIEELARISGEKKEKTSPKEAPNLKERIKGIFASGA